MLKRPVSLASFKKIFFNGQGFLENVRAIVINYYKIIIYGLSGTIFLSRVYVSSRITNLHNPRFFGNILKTVAFLPGCVVYLIHIVTRKGRIYP
jgi:hypothetical protein